jgi:hypothetical protein
MKHAAIGLALLLAGCGSPANVTVGPDGSVKVGQGGSTVTVNSRDCARAAFVPLYADAKVSTCVADNETAGEKRGTVIYSSAATPAAVLAWHKAEAEKAGLKVNLLRARRWARESDRHGRTGTAPARSPRWSGCRRGRFRRG